MPELKAQLKVKLDVSSLATQLLGEIAPPIGKIVAMTAPAASGNVTVVAGISGGLDLSVVQGAIGRVTTSAESVLGNLPGAEVLAPLTSAVELVESITVDDLA